MLKGMKWGFKGRQHRCIRERETFVVSDFDQKVSEIRCKYNIETMNDNQKEMLALDLLLKANGDVDAHNEACDIIKRLGLIKDYR